MRRIEPPQIDVAQFAHQKVVTPIGKESLSTGLPLVTWSLSGVIVRAFPFVRGASAIRCGAAVVDSLR